MGNSVYVAPGTGVALDRPSLSGPPPGDVPGLLEQCATWADEVGWTLADTVDEADGAVVGPGVPVPAGGVEVVTTERAQGVDGFRWAIRHLAFSRRWEFETLTYGLIADQEMDVRRPRRTRQGVAVLLHGGFWMDAWRRDLMEGIAVDLAQQGWESYNVEYGRVGGTGGWPRTGDDVVAAFDAVAAVAETDEVTVVGHSAGAQLALWVAAARPDAVRCVVSLSGLCDLEQAQRLRLGGGAVERFLAGADAASVSPLRNAGVDATVVAAHCETDAVVPVEQTVRYVDAARAAGTDVHQMILPEGNHMSLIEPEDLWPAARDAMVAATCGFS